MKLFMAIFFISIAALAAETPFEGANLTSTDAQPPIVVKLAHAPVDTKGTPAEIITRAQVCAAKTLSAGAVATSGGSEGFFGAIAGQSRTENGSTGADPLIVLADPSNGILVANSRAEYRHAFLGYSAKSRVTIEAKQDKFRITQTDVAHLQKDTGSMRNDGYTPMPMTWGIGWERALHALDEKINELSTCIARPAEADTW